MTIKQLRQLTALQAEDCALWDRAGTIQAGYIQQALRILTSAIEDEMGFREASERIQDMMP